MREEVCIVLNERESNKARAAETLQKSLDSLGIVSSRVEIVEGIEKLLAEKKPLILVLDYLLGDFSTGLDILHYFRESDTAKLPHFFFLTDEPSVQVAVEAMRLGAINYFELDHPLSIDKLTREIASLLESLKINRHRQSKREDLASSDPALSLDDFVAQTSAGKNLVKTLLLEAKKPHSLYVVHGKPGSGTSTIAHMIASMRAPSAVREVISLASETRSPEVFCCWEDSLESIRIGEGLCLIVENADHDDGELLEFISSHQERIWAKPYSPEQTPLIVVCNDEAVAAAWDKEAANCCLIKIPSLKGRTEDIPLLIQRFSQEASGLLGTKSKGLDAAFVSWLSSLEWPGEISELRSTVIDAIIALNLKDYISDAGSLKEFVNMRRDIWNESHKEVLTQENAKTLGFSAVIASRVLEEQGFRPRAAAARLGCTSRQLIKLLNLEESRE